MLTFCKIGVSTKRVYYLFSCILQNELCRSTDRGVCFLRNELSFRMCYFDTNNVVQNKVPSSEVREATEW
ncbi:unnamed protein product [Tenebrio molitor]|nr:unnamed protein product [Tenebrio molitor]